MSPAWVPPENEKRNMEYLKELHQRVKDHPYRLLGKNSELKSYQKLLWELGDIFYYVVKETKFARAKDMIHDYNRDVGNLSRETYIHKDSNYRFVESCISVVHEFIDTGEIKAFYAHNPNKQGILGEAGPLITWRWSKETEKYYLEVPVEKLDVLEKTMLKSIERWEKDNNESSKNVAKTYRELLKEILAYNKQENK